MSSCAVLRISKPKECTGSETKCSGGDLLKCVNNKWTVVERNSNQCKKEAGIPWWMLIAGAAVAALLFKG